jgi:hypothetical protein
MRSNIISQKIKVNPHKKRPPDLSDGLHKSV